jgi:hypothetical protein
MGLVAQLWLGSTSAAAGAWAGAALPVPAAAGVVAALVPVLLWPASVVLLVICIATAQEAWGYDFFGFWTGFVVFLPVIWCFFAALRKLFLWACRRSMKLPLALRAGAWALRKGAVLIGLAGESVEGLDAVLAGVEPAAAPTPAGAGDPGRHYKKIHLALWVFSAAAVISLGIAPELARPVARIAAGARRGGARPEEVARAAHWCFAFSTVLLVFLAGGAIWLFRLIVRQVKKLKLVRALR